MRLWGCVLVCFTGLMTHLVTISAIADEGISSGEGVLLKLNQDAPYDIVGRLNFGN